MKPVVHALPRGLCSAPSMTAGSAANSLKRAWSQDPSTRNRILRVTVPPEPVRGFAPHKHHEAGAISVPSYLLKGFLGSLSVTITDVLCRHEELTRK